MPLGMELSLSPGDIVLDGEDGDPSPLLKKGTEPPPQFSAHLLWPNTWMDQDGTWHGGGPHYARWGPSCLPKKGADPQFSAHSYCCQTAGCIKMPLGIEVGLNPGDFVLDGDPVPSPKGAEPPIFGPRILWPNGCIDQDAAWYRGQFK